MQVYQPPSEVRYTFLKDVLRCLWPGPALKFCVALQFGWEAPVLSGNEQGLWNVLPVAAVLLEPAAHHFEL